MGSVLGTILLIGKSHELLGNKWSRICNYLVGRTDNAIKNHWNSIMRKKFSEFRDKLEGVMKASFNGISKTDAILSLITSEYQKLQEDEEEEEESHIIQEAEVIRKDSSKSTRDEEKSPKQEAYSPDRRSSPVRSEHEILIIPTFQEDDYLDLESSPIVCKQSYQYFGLFEDISFSTNIPSFRFNSFCNNSPEWPFDL